jgi:hypothetical protein
MCTNVGIGKTFIKVIIFFVILFCPLLTLAQREAISDFYLQGGDSSAFGDATAANQTTILSRIGTNSDAASMSDTLFAGQQYIWDNRASFGNTPYVYKSDGITSVGKFIGFNGGTGCTNIVYADSNGNPTQLTANNCTRYQDSYASTVGKIVYYYDGVNDCNATNPSADTWPAYPDYTASTTYVFPAKKIFFTTSPAHSSYYRDSYADGTTGVCTNIPRTSIDSFRGTIISTPASTHLCGDWDYCKVK